MMPAFQTKAIDGFAVSQPWTLIPVHEQTAAIVASGPNGDLPELVPFGYNLLVTRPEVCEKRRIVCERMGQAFSMAVAFIHAEPERTFAIMRSRFGQMDERVLRRAVDFTTKATPRPPVVTRAGLENAEIYNVASGLMKQQEKLTSYDGLFSRQFVH